MFGLVHSVASEQVENLLKMWGIERYQQKSFEKLCCRVLLSIKMWTSMNFAADERLELKILCKILLRSIIKQFLFIENKNTQNQTIHLKSTSSWCFLVSYQEHLHGVSSTSASHFRLNSNRRARSHRKKSPEENRTKMRIKSIAKPKGSENISTKLWHVVKFNLRFWCFFANWRGTRSQTFPRRKRPSQQEKSENILIPLCKAVFAMKRRSFPPSAINSFLALIEFI